MKTSLLLALMLGSVAAVGSAGPALAVVLPASAPTVTGIVYEGQVVDMEELPPLATVRVGQPLSAAAIRDTLALFFQTGHYRGITVREVPEAGGVKLVFTFTRVERITSWRFSGNEHLDAGQLVRVMELTWAQALNPGRFDRWEQAIRERYRREGYPDVHATFSATPRGAGEVELAIAIREGVPVTIQRLSVLKQGQLRAEDVLKALSLKEGAVLQRETFFKGIDAIDALLVDHGFLNSRVGYSFVLPDGRRLTNYNALMDAAPGQVSVEVAVEEGQQALVRVEGDTLLPARDMAEAVTVYKNRSYSPFELDASAEALRKLFVDRGYPETRVTHRIAREEDRSYTITFVVDAGQHQTIEAIRFEGNAHVDEATLRRTLTTRPAGFLSSGGAFDAETWDDDLQNLVAYYQSQGYLTAKVTGVERRVDPDSRQITLVVRIDEGPRTLISRMLFSGTTPGQEAGILQALPINPGDPYNPRHLSDFIASVQAYYAKTGYPLAKVDAAFEPGTGPDASKEGVLRFQVTPGPRKRFGRLVLRGNLKTQDWVIRRQFTVEPGQRYNAEELFLTQQQIYQLGFFDRVSVEPIGAISERADDPVDLVINVHERETGSVSVGGGYGDRAAASGLTASAEYQQNNLLGYGWPLRLEGVLGTLKQSAVFSLRNPYVFGSDLVGEGGFSFLHEQVSPTLDTLSYGPSLGLTRQLSDFLLGSVRYSWNHVDYRNPAAADLNTLGGASAYNNSLVTTGLTYDSRSDITNPRWGSRAELNVDLATPFLGGTLLYTRPRVNLAHYIPFPRHWVLAVGGEAGYIQTLANANLLPSDLLFRAGGATSLRGYGYNLVGVPTGQIDPVTHREVILGGTLMAIGHAELRFPVVGDFGGVVFSDLGNVWARPTDLSFQSLRVTAGAGLRYQTPVGPVRLDYGIRLFPSVGFTGEHWYDNFYFGLGQAF